MKLKIADIDEQQLKDYLVAVAKIKAAPEDKINIALVKIKSGTSSHEDKVFLIESHLKHVIGFASRYRNASASFAKLIKAGNQGLITAVNNWHSEDSLDFIQYLNWHVEGSILSCLVKSGKAKINGKGE